MRAYLSLFLYCLLLGLVIAEDASPQLTPQQLEEWFQDDEREHPFDRQSDDGVLVFLASPPAKRTPHSRNILTIQSHSLQSGWVEIEQCHEQLDPVEMVEVVYRYKQMRGLHITKTALIGKAWVEGQSIQLEDVKQGAELCMQAEAKILYKQVDGGLQLKNGPFQRRFLDSYFPMHVTLTVRYPGDRLFLQDVSPIATDGFVVKKEPGTVHIDTWFEGKLVITLGFKPIT